MKKNLLLACSLISIFLASYAMDDDNDNNNNKATQDIDVSYTKPTQNTSSLNLRNIYFLPERVNRNKLSAAAVVIEHDKQIKQMTEFNNSTTQHVNNIEKKVKEHQSETLVQLNGFASTLKKAEEKFDIVSYNQKEYCTAAALLTTGAKLIRLLPYYARTLAPIGTFCAQEIPILATAAPAVSTVASICTSYYCLVPTTIALGAYCCFEKYKDLMAKNAKATELTTATKDGDDKDEEEKKLMEQKQQGNSSNSNDNDNDNQSQRNNPESQQKNNISQNNEGIHVPNFHVARRLVGSNIIAAIPTVLKHAAGLAILGYITSNR